MKSSGPACLICKSKNLIPIVTHASFPINIIECQSCNFIQSEFVSEETLDKFYSESYLNLTEAEIAEYKGKQVLQGKAQTTYIRSICGENILFSQVLDYGASLGGLAEQLKKISEKTFVTEHNPKYVEILEGNTHLSVIDTEKIFQDNFESAFDLVTLSHVLEHLPNPKHSLDNFHKIIKHSGLLMVDLPNEVQMLKQYGYQGRGHLYFFTLQTFRNLITLHGKFKIIDLRTCNRSVEDFLASGMTLQEDYSLQLTQNGAVIRALLQKK